MDFLINVLEQGFIFAIVSLGVYITYKILDFPDLSVDGTFPLGAAVAATCLMKNVNPYAACFLALAAGCLAGFVTGILHVKLKITNLMSGILVMIALYSINLRIMTKSNVPLFNMSTIFSGNTMPIIIIVIFSIGVKIVLDLFLKTKLGFVLKAVGDNEQLVTSLAVNKDVIKVIGLMLSNGLVALSGAMMAQYQGFADVGMGTGTVVMGLAAVIIGESIFGRLNAVKATTSAILGALIYKAAIAGALEIGLAPTDLKLVTAVIVVIALSLNSKTFNFKIRKKIYSGGDAIASNTESA
jgi:putative tryptophan/tyrosine transport system permease protein